MSEGEEGRGLESAEKGQYRAPARVHHSSATGQVLFGLAGGLSTDKKNHHENQSECITCSHKLIHYCRKKRVHSFFGG